MSVSIGEVECDENPESCYDRFISAYDLARLSPAPNRVAVATLGRPIVVAVVEEYERLTAFETGHVDSRQNADGEVE